MESGPRGPALVPAGQPIDLFVSVTDFAGHSMPLALNSPPRVTEQEHRLLLHFRQNGHAGKSLDEVPGLAAAARATASFPGAFPPFPPPSFTVVLGTRTLARPGRETCFQGTLPAGAMAPTTDQT